VANVPLRPNSGSAQFRHAWGEIILPQLDRFAPELVIISAGFDGHKADPLAQLNLETADFAWITGELLAIADRHANGRVISALEGGYDLDVLAEATAAHVGALMRLVQHE
jgi:acetoin utilization deacetylase AcuC-like enzyme